VRYTVNQARALPLLALQEAGVFAKEPGLTWRCVWKSGATIVSSLRLRLETSSEHACQLRLTYSMRSSGGSPVDHDYPVSVVGAMGPGRTSFLCPLRPDGRGCWQRCQVLYLPPDHEYFGCRHCHHLTAARRRGRRPTAVDLAMAVQTAENDVIHAASLAALLGAVKRLAAARASLAALCRSEIAENHEVESLSAAAKAVLRSPRPPANKELLQLFAKQLRVEKRLERRLRAEFDSDTHEPATLALEVSLVDQQ
jgi:hypothetical protein